MGQGGPSQREDPKEQDEWQGDAEHKPFDGSVHVDSAQESSNDGNDGDDEVDGIVIKELSCHFRTKIAEVDFSEQTHSVAVEIEADEVVLDVPNEDGQTTNR